MDNSMHPADRLGSLGYQGRTIHGIDVIIPPMCDVPAGEFLMGSDPARDKVANERELPQHRLNLSAFQIAKFPLTVAEYACFVRSGHPEPKGIYDTSLTWQRQLEVRLDHPVAVVSWHDVRAYAAWLSQLTQQHWRLPTEVEWEKAARGTDGRIYPWGDTFDASRCNTSEGGTRPTTPVGNYPSGASPYGAQDMAGNVYEWTSSLLVPYPYTPNDGREDANRVGSRVLRGGSWRVDYKLARSACRGFSPPKDPDGIHGVRLVRKVQIA
ncbi:MAG TPA: SUMF1/EgtB/PvdO family nonheme iron enzyme [Ktedonobacterales bacterium]